MPKYGYGAYAFGLPNFQSLIDNRENVLKWIKVYSPIEHVSKDDPPIALFYGGEVPVVGASRKDPTYSGIAADRRRTQSRRPRRLDSGDHVIGQSVTISKFQTRFKPIR